MINRTLHFKGRLFASGPFYFLLLWLLFAAPATAADDPTSPQNLQVALDKLEALKQAVPLDLDALQAQYLVLFENFPHHQKGKEGIWELYHLMRRNGRTSQAYAALMKILAVYQDNETMLYPLDPAQPIALAATARLEEAYLYAAGMNNPYQAVDNLNQTLGRYRGQLVGTVSDDRTYLGRVEVVARLQLAEFRTQADQPAPASGDLLVVARDWSGETVTYNGLRESAAVAAVRLLGPVLDKTPASLPKKERIIETFEQSLVNSQARLWLAFLKADIDFRHFAQWKAQGAFTAGAEALRGVIAKQRQTMMTDQNGREPAGIKAMRRLRDAEAQTLGNVAQAAQTLQGYLTTFATVKEDRLFAGYALVYLGELEMDFRQNFAAAYQYFMQAADRYSDLPQYPVTDQANAGFKEHCLRWAQRAQQRM